MESPGEIPDPLPLYTEISTQAVRGESSLSLQLYLISLLNSPVSKTGKISNGGFVTTTETN